MTHAPTTRAGRPAAVLVLAVALGLGAVACGSSGKKASTATTLSPEQVEAPMSRVVVELPKLSDLGDQVVAAPDAAAAHTLLDRIEATWRTVEGTVKATDIDTYDAIESAQGLMNAGVDDRKPDHVAQGAKDQRTAIDAFVRAHSTGAGAGS